MTPKVFLTGATGYIGGDVLHVIASKHPDWEFAALVRSKEKGAQISAAYPNVKLVFGSLDDSDVLKEESAKADIVIHTADASDHEGAAKAIAEGLRAGHSVKAPGYWLHTGGTGILTFQDSKDERYGELSEKVYNDLDGVEELTNLPDDAFHRNVDKVVLAAGTTHAETTKTALICPPTIYGTGRGPCSKRSRQVYVLAEATLQRKKAPVVGAGKARWNDVHIYDLSDLYCLLAEAAAANRLDSELWGSRGYYLAENGEHVWGEISKAIAEAAAQAGYIPAAETEPMGKEDAIKTAGFEALSWGLNSRGRALRARKLLNWAPHAPSLVDEIPGIVESEHARLTSS